MKKAYYFLVLLFAFSVFIQTKALAGIITHKTLFQKSDLKFSKLENYDVVRIEGMEMSNEVGAPQLPVYLINLAIPKGERVERIDVVQSDFELLQGWFDILPVQKPVILSSAAIKKGTIALTQPDISFYSKDDYYPSKVVQILGTSQVGDINFVTLHVFPLQYSPVKKQLKFFTRITLQLTTGPDPKFSLKKQHFSRPQAHVFQGMIKNLLTDPDQTELANTDMAVATQTDDFQYLIVTSRELVKNFEPLSDWKTRKGVPAKIVSLEWIYDNFGGSDSPDRIRNFIRHAYQNWGTIWVLLGGDVNIVPHRTAFAMDCEFGADPRENDIPSDLYYADLDGSWNSDGDEIYGEVDDAVDLYPEIFLGRAPVENAAEADIFVQKVLTYEKNPPPDYQRNLLFAAEILWNKPYTNTGIGKDMIERESLRPGFYHITKLYEDSGNESIASVTAAINSGQNIINHHGHAGSNVMGMGDGYLNIGHVLQLKNGAKQSIIYSIGCYPANFERDCIAEAFINNPEGGAVAFIGNSRYGWGSPGNPGFGYSDRFDSQFFRFLFKEKNYQIGRAIALAKAYYVPYSRQENVYRWCMYEINLLGDPEMPVWTDDPDTLTVHYPSTISPGNLQIPITVASHGSPVKNALVCLMQGATVYQYGNTGANGQVVFDISLSNPSQKLALTVTAHNFFPFETSIDVASNAAFVSCTDFEIDDSQGNGDGLINPGEKFSLIPKFKNFGQVPATNIYARISSSESFITIEDALTSIGDMAGKDSMICPDTFTLSLDSTCENGDVLQLEMLIFADGGYEWKQAINFQAATPVLCLNSLRSDDSIYGNNNGVAEPGERVTFFAEIGNRGLALAKSVESFLTIDDLKIDIEPKSAIAGDIPASGTSIDSFWIDIPDNYSAVPAFPTIQMSFSTADGFVFSLHFKLTIGRTGFEDDVESGSEGWQTPDSELNHWHISPRKHFSGSHSWYCGNESNGNYFRNDDCVLESPPFYPGQNAQLSFYAWYNVAIYGVNGFYVQISDDGGTSWQKLDFIGSGGALDSSLMGNDWLPYTYDLSGYNPGTLTRIRFQWVSDSQSVPAEGMSGAFIDDIRIISQVPMPVTGVRVDLAPLMPEEYSLSQNYPNPFNAMTKIDYQIAGESFQMVKLSIYNLLGQRVKMVVNQAQAGGNYTVLWDGTNEQNNRVSSGIYIYQLAVSGFKLEKKLIVLR